MVCDLSIPSCPQNKQKIFYLQKHKVNYNSLISTYNFVSHC